MSNLRISEIFTSIQGEGLRTGCPSIFVRVSGCNLRCVWCDTPYASWQPEGPVRSVQSIIEELQPNPVRDVVLTGGEPMIFDSVCELTARLHQLGKFITIETAGTQVLDVHADLMSISPKLSHSTPTGTRWEATHRQKRIQIPVLRELTRKFDYQLKFVVNPESDADDMLEILDILEAMGDVDAGRVLLMPEGRDSETLNRRARLLVEPAIKYGFRLAGRLQIDLFGDTRGT